MGEGGGGEGRWAPITRPSSGPLPPHRPRPPPPPPHPPTWAGAVTDSISVAPSLCFCCIWRTKICCSPEEATDTAAMITPPAVTSRFRSSTAGEGGWVGGVDGGWGGWWWGGGGGCKGRSRRGHLIATTHHPPAASALRPEQPLLTCHNLQPQHPHPPSPPPPPPPLTRHDLHPQHHNGDGRQRLAREASPQVSVLDAADKGDDEQLCNLHVAAWGGCVGGGCVWGREGGGVKGAWPGWQSMQQGGGEQARRRAATTHTHAGTAVIWYSPHTQRSPGRMRRC